MRIERHRNGGVRAPVLVPEGAKVKIARGVAADDERVFPRDKILAVFHRACGAERSVLAPVLHAHAEAAAVAEVLHDGRGQMPHCDEHIRHALLLQGFQLPLQHRTPVNGQHRLGEIPCQRGDAGAAASGHDNSFHNAGSSSGA